MNNNDILRRTRYILDLKDNQISKIFKHVNIQASEKQVNQWLKREEETGFIPLPDETLIEFLDALIIDKRGPKDDGPRVKIKQQLDNNLILMKLKIAFHLKAEEALAVMELAGFKISKHEFSALFRKKDHKHYRACKNQMLRKFMKGLQIKYRGQTKATKKTTFNDAEPRSKAGKLSLKKKPSKPQAKSQKNKKFESKQMDSKTTAASVWKVPKKPIN